MELQAQGLPELGVPEVFLGLDVGREKAGKREGREGEREHSRESER